MRNAFLLGTAIPAFALGLASVVNLPEKLIYNASESAPVGSYWVDQKPVSRGDLVYVRAPERVRNLVVERGYMPPAVPLLKHVAGLDGDRVCRFGEAFFVNESVVARALQGDARQPVRPASAPERPA